jgi:hypothetical protein
MSFKKIQIISADDIGNPEVGHIYFGRDSHGLWEKESSGYWQYVTTGGTGSSGTSGTSGISNGTSGVSGSSGTSGTSGLTGTSGSSGTSGRDGNTSTSGTSGSSGYTGSSGTSGVGSPGTSGTSGSSGFTGSSGTSGKDGNFYGTSGSSGYSGGYGGATRLWIYSSTTPVSGEFNANISNLDLITGITINTIDYDGQDVSNWIKYWNSGIFKIEEFNNFDSFGIYTGVTATEGAPFSNLYTLSNFSLYSANGNLSVGKRYLISFVPAGGGGGGIGTPGTSGTSGKMGTSGSSGITGTHGTSGSSGISGTHGTSGSSGTSGTSGTSGGNVFGIDYFIKDELDPTLSGLTYYQLERYSPNEIEQDDFATITGSTSEKYFIEAYVSPDGDPGINFIPAGIWKLHSYTYVDSITPSSINNLIADIYLRSSGGTETLLATLTSEDIQSTDILNPTDSDTEYYTNSGLTIDLEDRIVIKFYAQSTYTGRVVHFLHSGFLHATHITTPITQGAKGNDGTSGTSGKDGSSGTSGISGSSGTSGSSGISFNNIISIPSTDFSVNGMQIALTASGNTNFGDVGYINTLGGVTIASASAITTANAVVMCADSYISGNTSGNWLLFGAARKNTWNWLSGGTSGLIYLSTSGTTTNTLTQIQPSDVNQVIQILGVALTSNTIYFKPELVQVEHI